MHGLSVMSGFLHDLFHTTTPSHYQEAHHIKSSIMHISDKPLTTLTAVNLRQKLSSQRQCRAEADELQKICMLHLLAPCKCLGGNSESHGVVVHCRHAAPGKGEYPYPANTSAWQAIQWGDMGTATYSWRTSIGSILSNRRIQLCFPGMFLNESC